MQIPEAPKKPWEWVMIDFVGALPKSTKETRGKDFDMIMVMVDRLTKYAYFELTTTNAMALETAKIFMKKIII
jgi:hypothetical protein